MASPEPEKSIEMVTTTSPQTLANLSGKYADQIAGLFEKKFKYTKNPDWILPPPSELFKEFYQFDNFQLLKQELNAVKSKLNDYTIEEWSAHTRRKDPSSEISWYLKNEVKAEFVTVAWCKLFECLHRYNLVKDGRLNSLHLCEAPGAFVAALNHYLQSNCDEVHWNWLATTLNPYWEGNPLKKMIMDDRFMVFTLDHWLFHDDFTGNIIDCSNIEQMAKECKDRLGEVHLITADGSVDCMDTPDNQEECVATLHFAELCAALLILSKGGSFVLKMFTLFEAVSVSLVYFLNCIFEEVHVFKPVTSKRGNSEVYIICLEYQKPANIGDYLSVMLEKLNTGPMFPLFAKADIPADFRMQHEVCARRFMSEQMKAIEANIYLFHCPNSIPNRESEGLRTRVREVFLEFYKIQPIPAGKMILQTPESKIEHGIHTQIYRGSHTERQCMKQFSPEAQLLLVRKSVNEIEKRFAWQHEEIACLRRTANDRLPLRLYKGKQVDTIHSSLFTAVELLILRPLLKEFDDQDPIFIRFPQCRLGDDSNFRVYYSDQKNFGQNQREFFTKFLEIIIDRKPKMIKFSNFPFLSHYSVSILRYLAANVYDTCRILGNGEIILELEGEYNDAATQSVVDLHEKVTESPDVLCFVDILHLHQNKFCKVITDFNNHLLLRNYRCYF